MDKIKIFKKEVLTLKIYSKINYYPGNPYYIGKDRDERLKKSIEESKNNDFLSAKNNSLYKELTSTETISQYYVELADDAVLFDLLEEALYSTDDFSIDDLKVVLDLLVSYKYDAFLEELDLLRQKFLNFETIKEDEHRFKTVFRKQFGYSMPQSGKITEVFVNNLRSEMEKRMDYLESFKGMIEKVIAIKGMNESIAFTGSIGLESFPKNDPEIQSIIDCNIERKQVKPLFEFIDFLHFNRSQFIEYNSFVGEYERLKKEREKMSLLKNYKALEAKKEIDRKIEVKKVWIHTNITEPIIKKLEYLGVYDEFEYELDSDCESYVMPGIDSQKKYCTSDAFKLIQIYEDRYVEFREATKYNQYDCFDLFEGVDNMLEDLFSFVHEDDVSQLKVSKEKHLESIGVLSDKPTIDNELQTVENRTNSKKGDRTETLRENKTSITRQTKTLFNFIDFLHSNIENINQNMGVLLEWKKARWQERQFGQHYSEKLIMREVQKVIRAKWDEISEHLIEPIKEKAIEINVCVLDNPKSIYTNFSHHVVMLQENFHEEDVDEIMKVKKQYIEIRNDINPHIILLLKDFFKYFDELMKHLVAFFYEDGDRTIPRIVDIYLDDYFSTPESFELPLSDSQVKDFYNRLLIKYQEVICEDTDFDYFSYAISGKEIPLKKTPYKPVVLAGAIDSMYYELFNLMKNCGEIPEKRKTIPQKYVMLAEKLFLNKNENPLKLRTPK